MKEAVVKHYDRCSSIVHMNLGHDQLNLAL